ncbi:hypothetical protein F5Y07DRAFT_22797 [Xylaria sp. FL0933]|nr:hypothetical protein F5Y07DRAFT_22797 [Xylaria sp. FL0933]
MATIPGEQWFGWEFETDTNVTTPPTPDSTDNGQTCEERHITFSCPWNAARTHMQDYPGTAKADVMVLTPDDPFSEVRLSGCLDKIQKLSIKDASEVQVKLLLPDAACDDSDQTSRIDSEDDSSRSSRQHVEGNGTAAETQRIDPTLCGNCGADDHRAAVCAKLEESGWMEVCCKCDSREHTYEYCPHRGWAEDFRYLILNRGNKPPVKCSFHLGRIVLLGLAGFDSPYNGYDIIALPYSSVFSRQVARQDPTFVKSLKRDSANNLVEPARYNQPLGRAVSMLMDQRWTTEDEDNYSNNYWGSCENCLLRGHSVYNCASSCGFCGSHGHQTWSCESKDKACLCREYPGHTHWECPSKCWYCAIWMDSDHAIGSCPVICHHCLDPDHMTRDCKIAVKERGRACSRCPRETYHCPLVHMLCPGANCKRRINASPCEDHCPNCG